MLKLKINKKGIKASGFSVIIGAIILFLTFGTIFMLIKNQATKVDEGLQVDICRISNAIKYGLKEKTGGTVSIAHTCNTIDKTKGKMQVPTKKYPQNKIGAETEMREMIKNCWYMWLEGSKFNMFEKQPFSRDCFTCYIFKIKDNVEGITFKSLEESMSEPFFAQDTSDNCAGNGGYWKEKCETGETETKPKDLPEDPNLKCCIKGITNECENKGGLCFPKPNEEKPVEYNSIYNGWSCPKRDQSCYVKEDNRYSYTRYIREYGPRGGEILFIPPDGGSINTEDIIDTEDIEYKPGEIYTISFVSPSKQFCGTSEEGGSVGCWAAVGGYAIGAIAALVGGGFLLAHFGIGAVTATTFKVALGAGKAGIATHTAAGVAYETGLLEKAKDGAINFFLNPITVEVPNSIIVSTLEHTQEFGCTIDIAE